jgi:hypothetical protein
MRLRRAALAASLVLAGARTGAPQTRPVQTEEAFTARGGTVLLETGVEAIRGEPNFLTGRPRDRWAGPLARLVYAPADNVEIDVEWTARVGARDDPDFGSVSDWGDVALRAKVRLAGGETGALGARFAVVLPETSFGNGLGPNALRMRAEVVGSRRWGGAAVHANAGLALHDEVLRAHEQRDFFSWGLAAERTLGRLTVVAEAAGLAGSGAPGAEAHAEARAGVRVGTGRVRWDAAVRRGLADADGTWGVTAGLALTLSR